MLMNIRRWLLASCLCATFLFAPAARAAGPAPTTIPKAPASRVKLRLPTFIAFGLGGLSAGGAMAAGFAAQRGNDPTTCDSRCTEKATTQRQMLIATGLLTGAAAVGIGVGITLMIKAPKDPRRYAVRPRFDLGLSGQKAVAKIGWVF